MTGMTRMMGMILLLSVGRGCMRQSRHVFNRICPALAGDQGTIFFIKFMFINWFKLKSTPGAWMHGHLGHSLSEESSSNAWRICHRSSWSMSRQLWHHWQQRVCHRGAWYKIRWIFERLEATVIVRIFTIGAVNVTLSCCVYNDKLFQKDTMIKADAYRCEILVCEEKVGGTKWLKHHFSSQTVVLFQRNGVGVEIVSKHPVFTEGKQMSGCCLRNKVTTDIFIINCISILIWELTRIIISHWNYICVDIIIP